MIRDQRHRAFTLLELVLVLALLVALAALAWPALDGPLDGIRLRKAADRLCTAWGNARLSAMTNGTIYVFRFQPGSDRYLIEPWNAHTGDPDAAEVETDSEAAADIAADTSVPDQRINVRLPGGILFGTARHQAQPGRTGSDQQLPGVSDSEMILFYPDGTAFDVTVSLRSDRQLAITVSLRGITGAASVGATVPADELGW